MPTLRGIRASILPCGRALVALSLALLLLPIDASKAWRWPWQKEESKPATQKHHTDKPVDSKLAASKPATPKAAAVKCEPAKFHLVVDVGHTKESDGAMSARNVPEFEFNLKLARRVVEKLKADGFAETRLLVTEGKARPSLIRRVAAANNSHADLFLSIHHDSVPDKMLEDWEFEGRKSHFSDRFRGHSLFVSKDNANFSASMHFAQLIGEQLKAKGLSYATQYTLPIMGKYRHELLDKDFGIYRYDHLVVLMRTSMPAVLLEAGSIINRDEEVQMASSERQNLIIDSVAAALKQYCGGARAAETASSPATNGDPAVHPP